MKGLIVLGLLLLSLSANATQVKPTDLFGIKVDSGEIIKNLNLMESAKVLKSLQDGENIEIRYKIIYPEQVTQLILGKLTKVKLLEKRPNPQDYN